MSQDVTPQQAKSCNELVEHQYALRKFETLETTKRDKKGRILAAIIADLKDWSRP